MDNVWEEIKAALKEQIPSHSFHMWIEPLQLSKSTDEGWVITCPNPFSRRRVQDKFGHLIENLIRQVSKNGAGPVSYQTTSRKRKNNGRSRDCLTPDPQLLLPAANARPHSGRLLRKDFTFDHFVVGGSNDFAYSASLCLASKKDVQQSSLFLLSKTGLGKSHLAQAVGNHVLIRNPEERVYYVTAEDFSNEMVQAFRHDSIDRFKTKYRNHCDVLLLEDIHDLSGKQRTQVELALTLDSLFEAGKRIIFSSCYLPGDIPKMSDKLRSRLSSSMISAIDPPDFRTRVRILQKKAAMNGYNIPLEVLQYLANELTDDVRQLESGMSCVVAKSSLLGMPIDLGLAASVVKHLARQRKQITIDVIKKLVCKYYSVSAEDIGSKSRKRKLVRPRQMAMYLARLYTDAPLQTIGKSFNRYHATALHSINSIERELKSNSVVQQQVQFFRKKLDSGKY
jgi:chromosomal replication initiator protein